MWGLIDYYYLSNQMWVYGNILMVLPFLIACICRFNCRDVNKHLWTDHLARACLLFTFLFYFFDIVVKYQVDGGDTICQKSFYIHHFTSLFIMPPIILNDYIPWWVGPVGFLHGFCLYFPEFEPLIYIYALTLFVFHYGIYQKPYTDFKYYRVLHFSINGIWVFAILLLIGDCSNYLPLGPD